MSCYWACVPNSRWSSKCNDTKRRHRNVASVLSTPGVSLWLQTNLNKFLGPLLILVGMVLLFSLIIFANGNDLFKAVTGK